MSEALISRLYAHALDVVEHLPLALALLALFLGAVLQIVLPPVPGDALLPTIGALSVALPLPLGGAGYFLCYWAGTFGACLLMLEVGRRWGDRLLQSRRVRRLLPEDALEFSRNYLTRYGGRVLLATKFIPGVNTPALALAGAMGLKRADCLPAIAAATLLQNGLLFLLGRWMGDNFWAIVSVLRSVSTAGLILLVVAVGAAGFGVRRAVRARAGREDDHGEE